MQKEQITDKEAICLLIVFVIGSSLIVGVGGEVNNDAWIAGIVGCIMAIPMLLVFSRILSLFQGKDLFDILNIALGKVIGRIVAIIYIWYAFHLGALVLRNFGEFIKIVAMPETPMFVSLLCLGLVCIIAVRLGIEVLGRTTTYFLPILFFTLVVVELLAIPQLHLDYIKPILGNGLISVLKGGFSTFSFPFAETVLFIGVFGSLKTKKSPFKVYYWGILISAIIIIITTIRNIAVLGNMMDSFYFPSYAAVGRIKIGDFLERIEVSVAIVFVFGVFVKSSICLLVACKGIGKMFNLKDYRSIVIQTGLLMIYFSYTVFDNSMEMKYWAFKVYPFYAFPFQVILPIIIWISAEIKARKNKMTI
ncbi:endospore germination permease [Desulfitobacterium sp.]|uniref:GerAB/ArcD/ProY family transporter n=1 Tax=Desulfitobacterium sp. TaxID=49981 RepID=UPI002CA7F4FB|nr:endospore germination permease [Desulfitobacterium sp.]HVJ48250.1 endospore germination permease [Desulfitobacterium sp.]